MSDLIIERTFDAPIEKVWAAWTEPEMYMKWWGPEHFTAPLAEMDVRPGGINFSAMQDPSGKRYYSIGTYEEVTPMTKLVYTDSFADENKNIVPASFYGMEGDRPVSMRVTVLLEDADGKTKMTLRHEGLPEGEMTDQTSAGWNQSFDKLNVSVK